MTHRDYKDESVNYFNASKLGPGNCEMGTARVKYDNTTVSYTRILRHFWVDSGINGKAFGQPGDYLVILNGVRRIVSADLFKLNFTIIEEAP